VITSDDICIPQQLLQYYFGVGLNPIWFPCDCIQWYLGLRWRIIPIAQRWKCSLGCYVEYWEVLYYFNAPTSPTSFPTPINLSWCMWSHVCQGCTMCVVITSTPLSIDMAVPIGGVTNACGRWVGGWVGKNMPNVFFCPRSNYKSMKGN
jgi:hypothetical protein